MSEPQYYTCDARGWMLNLTRIISRDAIGVSPAARDMVHNIVFYLLSERSPRGISLILEEMLEQDHPMVLSQIHGGEMNSDLLGCIDDIGEELRIVVPKVTQEWKICFHGDMLQVVTYPDPVIRPATIREFRRHLRKRSREEGTYVGDILNALDEFESNRTL